MFQLLANQPTNQTTSDSQPLVYFLLSVIFILAFVGIYSLISCVVASKSHTDNRGFVTRAIIKALLIVAIAIFALVNYRVFSFSKGFSKSDLDNNNSEAVITELLNINKIEYYDTPLANEQPYIIYVETAQSGYLFRIDNDGISTLSTVGIFANTITPQKISPIPFWIEIIVAVVITFIPFRSSKKIENSNAPRSPQNNKTKGA